MRKAYSRMPRAFGYRDAVRERVIRSGAPVAAMTAVLIGVAVASGAVAAEHGPNAGPQQPTDAGGAPNGGGGVRVGEGTTFAPPALIVGSSMCPQPDAVWAELGTLVPRERLAQRLLASSIQLPAVQIIDLGIPYRVIAAGRVREYRDEVRDCAHRARVAALFVALTFDPPVGAPTNDGASTASGEPPIVAARPETRPTGHVLRLDVGGAGEAGLGPDGHVSQFGVAFRLAIGRGAWALVLGTVALWPADMAVNGLRLRHVRVPVEIGVRAKFNMDSIAPYGEVGLGTALLSERALDLGSDERHAAIEVGAFAAVGLRFVPSNRFAPFVTARGELVPSPPAIQALPGGVVGHTPVVWLGAAAGVSIDF